MNGPYRITDREVPLGITGYFMPTDAPNEQFGALPDEDACEHKVGEGCKKVGHGG